MKSLNRLIVLLVVLAGLTLATGVAYAGQLDINQLAGVFRPDQHSSPGPQGFVSTDLQNDAAQQKNSSSTNDDSEFEIIGVVTSITTDTIVVSDTVIAITPETEFEDEVAVGDMVKVEAFYADDGTLTAAKIELYEDDGNGDYFNIIGTLTAITTDTLTVDDTIIAVTPDTIFEDQVAVGDMVKVKAFYADDGTLTAHKVSLYQENDHGPGYGYEVKVQIVGVVDSFSVDSIVVSGVAISVTDQTKIVGDIEVGDTVKVHAFLADDGTLTAWKIKWLPDAVSNPGHGNKTTVIRGVVDSLTEDTIIVSGISFSITMDTVFSGDVGVGDTVKVQGYTTEDGILTASRIIKQGAGSDKSSGSGDATSSPRNAQNNPGKGNQNQGGTDKNSGNNGGNHAGGNGNNGGNHAGGNGNGGGNNKGGGNGKGMGKNK